MQDDLIPILKKRNQELLILLEINRNLTEKLNLEELLREIMHQATKVVNAESSSLILIDEATNELVFNIAMGNKGNEIKKLRLKVNEGIAGWVAANGKALLINDVSKDGRFNSKIDDITKYKTKSILCVPLKIKSSIIGVMEAINRKDGSEFTQVELDIFSDFAAQASVAIDNAKLFGNLEQEKEKIEAVFSGMGDGAVFTDADFKVLMINRAACNLLNIEQGKFIGKNLKELENDFYFIDLNKIKDELIKVILFDMTRRIGKKLYISCKMTRIIDPDRKTMGFVLILRDITTEKSELMITRDFFSLISHKLKTPLVAITGYTPMLLNEKEFGPLNDFQRSAINSIHQQSKHLHALIEEILTFTSLGTDDTNVHPEKTGIFEVAGLAIKRLSDKIADSGVIVEWNDFIKTNPFVYADAIKLAGVIFCLVENAIKFNDKTGKKVSISAKSSGDYLTVEIGDNGPGIPSEEYDNIFKKFYQVEENFTGQVEGAGLGLAYAKEIVEKHKGEIRVKSVLGEGTVFSFTLLCAK